MSTTRTSDDTAHATIEELQTARAVMRKVLNRPNLGISNVIHCSHALMTLIDCEDELWKAGNWENSLIEKDMNKGNHDQKASTHTDGPTDSTVQKTCPTAQNQKPTDIQSADK
jgi:hypothetical protein